MRQIATKIYLGQIELPADISFPDGAYGVVLFVHGSGSGRFSPRNRRVASLLNQGSISTVLVDLLTPEEEAIDLKTAALRFNIALLARRVGAITDWVRRESDFKNMRLGYFGASTGAAAALVAAADRSNVVKAIVSRGGRPDLAESALKHVLAPTLLIVGEADTDVLQMNYSAMAEFPSQTTHKLEVIPGATHLFEEPEALDKVAALACSWFREHLAEC